MKPKHRTKKRQIRSSPHIFFQLCSKQKLSAPESNRSTHTRANLLCSYTIVYSYTLSLSLSLMCFNPTSTENKNQTTFGPVLSVLSNSERTLFGRRVVHFTSLALFLSLSFLSSQHLHLFVCIAACMNIADCQTSAVVIVP